MTPTPEGKQLAADLANAVRVSRGKDSDWAAGHFAENCDDPSAALARLATEHLALKAQLEEALEDLREIDRVASPEVAALGKVSDVRKFQTVATIAAKWRVETDSLVEALMSIVPDIDCDAGESPAEAVARQLRTELSKRGYEIGGKS